MDENNLIKELKNRIVELETENSQLKTKNRRLEYVAFKDLLTGAYNRNYLDLVIKPKYEKSNCFVGFVDLNNLKAVNDVLGHDAGDKIIIDTCKKLSDICLTIRLGGDEFLIIIEKKNEKDILPILLKKAIIDKKYSLGIVEKTKNESFSSAMKRADFMMYLDKQRIKDGKPIRGMIYPAKPGEKSSYIPLKELLNNSSQGNQK